MRSDTLLVLKIIIIIECVLLLLFGFIAGKAGLIVAIILTNIACGWFYVYAKAMGAAFSNSRSKVNSRLYFELLLIFIIVSSMSIYLAFGINLFINFVKTDSGLSSYFYYWLASVVITVVSTDVFGYMNDPNRKLEARLNKENAQRQAKWQAEKQKEEESRKAYNTALFSLKDQFEITVDDVDDGKLSRFIIQSEEMATQFGKRHELPSYLANYSVKLMVSTIKQERFDRAQLVLNSYMNIIVPYVGLSEKSTDVASIGIIVAMKLQSDSMFENINSQILGNDFNIDELTNETLVFNLACYYALKQDLEQLILCVKHALTLGKTADEFLQDGDFDGYKTNEVFLSALN